MTTFIDIELTDGRHITGRADFGKGSPADPMSYDDVADKFRGCAALAAWPKNQTEDVIAMVRDLEEIRDIARLTGALSRTR